jgi:hypothetical protein
MHAAGGSSTLSMYVNIMHVPARCCSVTAGVWGALEPMRGIYISLLVVFALTYMCRSPCGVASEQTVAFATTDSSAGAAAANSAHTTTLANPNAPDFAWQRGYSWYPDTPGQYPAGKMDWYYSSGGLYDQAHHSNAQVHTSTLANPNSSDFAWQRGYSWYPDTPGQYPAGKMDWYYSSGGLYDQAHHSQLAVLPTTEGPSEKPKETKPTPANPGHLLMCGHAIVLGAVEATGKLVVTGKIECFTEDLKAAAKEAASVGSPVGGFIMREHILKEEAASA